MSSDDPRPRRRREPYPRGPAAVPRPAPPARVGCVRLERGSSRRNMRHKQTYKFTLYVRAALTCASRSLCFFDVRCTASSLGDVVCTRQSRHADRSRQTFVVIMCRGVLRCASSAAMSAPTKPQRRHANGTFTFSDFAAAATCRRNRSTDAATRFGISTSRPAASPVSESPRRGPRRRRDWSLRMHLEGNRSPRGPPTSASAREIWSGVAAACAASGPAGAPPFRRFASLLGGFDWRFFGGCCGRRRLRRRSSGSRPTIRPRARRPAFGLDQDPRHARVARSKSRGRRATGRERGPRASMRTRVR